MSEMMGNVTRELIALYKQDKPEASSVKCEVNLELDYLELASESQQRRTKIAVSTIESIENASILPMWVDIDANKARERKFELARLPRLGVFKISLTDGNFLYCARYLQGQGQNAAVVQISATEEAVWQIWLKLVHVEHKRRVAIPKGISTARMSQMGLNYRKVTRFPTFPAIHPEFESLQADIRFFFGHVSQFTRYNQPGVRKAMLVGPPGTGKTSICMQIAREFSTTIPVVFTVDIVSCAHHLAIAAKQKTPTIAILEDADSSLMQASSDVLNFLDGINQPQNPHGSFIIMTTNFPERIEPRILQRPGRIDRLYQVGELDGAFALQCAKLYFPDDMQIADEQLTQLVVGLTGAQIKELAQSCISYAVSLGQPLTAELIRGVKDKIAEDLREVYKYAESHSPMLNRRGGFGFPGAGDPPPRPVPPFPPGFPMPPRKDFPF